MIVVTGGAKGIGEAIVRGCAAEGAIPVIVDRDREAAANLQTALLSGGAESEVIVAEIAAPEACARAVEQTLGKFGRIDALVNNAGVNDKVGLEHGSPEKFVASLSRNLIHFYAFAHYALPALKKTRGAIVNISSKTAVTGPGRNFGIRSFERRDSGAHPRMGRGAAAARHSRERGDSRRSEDAALPAMAHNF